jgi:hypothetical protein
VSWLQHVQDEYLSEDFKCAVNTSAEIILNLLLEFCDQLVVRVDTAFIRRVVSNMLQKFVGLADLVPTQFRYCELEIVDAINEALEQARLAKKLIHICQLVFACRLYRL